MLTVRDFIEVCKYFFVFIEALFEPKVKNVIRKADSKRSSRASKSKANIKKSKIMFAKETLQFVDYCKTFDQPKNTDKSRFLNNIYLSIFCFVTESQSIAVVNSSYNINVCNSVTVLKV